MNHTILITGGSGFIAASVLNVFLEAGYNVRTTVRSEEAAERVRRTHARHKSALSFVAVPEMAVQGAYDEAVQDVDGVVHIASPFFLDAQDIKSEIFYPAYNGTISILRAVKDLNPKVKRIVITSSVSAVLDFFKGMRPGYSYTEADWNPMKAEDVTDPATAYFVSKAIAEKAAFDFVDHEKPNFSICTILPALVYGPDDSGVKKPSDLNASLATLYHLFNGSAKEVPATPFPCLVDVRDVAQAHLRAYEFEVAANQRYLVSTMAFDYQQVVNVIREEFPDLRSRTPEGDATKALPDVFRIDQQKSIDELGLTYRSLRETVVDSVKRMLKIDDNVA